MTVFLIDGSKSLNCYNYFEKHTALSHKIVHTDIIYDSTIPLPRETHILTFRDVCWNIHSDTIFRQQKPGNNPVCIKRIDEWTVYVPTKKYCTAVKMNKLHQDMTIYVKLRIFKLKNPKR